MRNAVLKFLLLSASVCACASAGATVFTGTLYFTRFSGAPNVSSVVFTYNDATQSFVLAPEVPIAQTNGADGIIFAPNGNLLIGGQGSGNVYEVNRSTGAVVGSGNALGGAVFHLALDPSGTKVYSSDFGGPLKTFNLPLSNATTTPITGSENGVTGLAFDNEGDSFYVTGNPNGFGNVGHINVATGQTTRIFTGLMPAHGMVYDGFTDLMTLFGAGAVGTFDADAGSDAAILASLRTRGGINCDFDQGAVDGQGHALIAGCNSITFIDYRATGDITSPLNFVAVVGGFINIDDVAPLSGLGSENPVPEPGSLGLLGLALAIFGFARRGRRH